MQLKSVVDDLNQQLTHQDKENDALHRLLSRQARGVAEQGPSSAQVGEMDRLRAEINGLQKELRDAQHNAPVR